MKERVHRLTFASLILSAIFFAGLAFAAEVYESSMALAQAADSLFDMAGAVVLYVAVRIARSPRDEGHPMGHSRAEPLGALFVAALSAVLAFEVGSDAFSALSGGVRVRLERPLLAWFAVKAVVKAVIWALSGGKGSALRALHVDARNDVAVGLLAVLGFFLAKHGLPALDAWFALPVALWIGYSGFGLAKENVGQLMGEAPPKQRQRELVSLAGSVEGVLDAHDLTAQYLGSALSVHVHLGVSSALTLREAHDLGEVVRQRLLLEPDVSHCTVHLDPVDPEG